MRALALAAGLFLSPGASAAPGDLDTAFGSSGLASWDNGGAPDEAFAVAVQPDGRILAAGRTHNGSDFDLALARFNADGSLDTGFGTGGAVTWDGGHGHDAAHAVAVQPDGRILVAGFASNQNDDDLALARLNADGSLDTGFGAGDGDGTDGFVIRDRGHSHDQARSLALYPDGRILVGGYAHDGTYLDLALARFNADGSLDTGFGAGDGDGSDGFAFRNGPSSSLRAYAVALQPDGRIVAAGRAYVGTDDFALARFRADGAWDTTFGAGDGDGVDGLALWDSGNGGDWGRALALRPDGRILVAGTSHDGLGYELLTLAGFTADGSLDTSFATDPGYPNGIAAWNNSTDARGYSVALQPDGRILVGGYGNNTTDLDFAVLRFDPDGSRDTTFGSSDGDGFDGLVLWDGGNGTDLGSAVALQSDGRILAAGEANNGTDSDLGVVRLAGGPAWNAQPDSFGLADQDGVATDSRTTSETVLVGGLDSDVMVPVHTGTGGLTVLDDTGAQVHSDAPFAWVGNGYTFKVSHTSASSGGSSVTSTVTAGGVRPPNNPALALGATQSASFTSTTEGGGGGGGGGGGCTLAPGGGYHPGLGLLALLALAGWHRRRLGR